MKKYLQVNDIYNSGVLSSGPVIVYTVDGEPVRTSSDD